MKPVWILDADGIEFNNEEIDNVFSTLVVDQFLDNEKNLESLLREVWEKHFSSKQKGR